MELQHGFTVPASVDEAWQTLLDIERVAPCMPGATLDEVTGDEFSGRVKVRVGPISLTYKGTARFAEKDDAAHRAVIEGTGKDTRGNGTASAKVTANLSPDGDLGDWTRVDVQTDLTVTGRPAQFGRGVMSDVGDKLIGQFADCLAGKLAGAGAADAGAEAESVGGTGDVAQAAGGQPRSVPSAEPPHAEAIDLFSAAGPAVAKRIVPAALGFGLLLLIIAVFRRRRRHR